MEKIQIQALIFLLITYIPIIIIYIMSTKKNKHEYQPPPIMSHWHDEHLKVLEKRQYKKNWINKFVGAMGGKPEKQICYKSNKECKYNCSGLCKESC